MKTCLYCGKSLNGLTDQKRRKYCDIECYSKYRLSAQCTNQSTGHYRARKIAHALTCERCGKSAKHVHHKDREPTNNKPENLESLCTKCHALEHKRKVALSTCAVCGMRFIAKSHRNRNKICSAQCAREWGRICAQKRWSPIE